MMNICLLYTFKNVNLAASTWTAQGVKQKFDVYTKYKDIIVVLLLTPGKYRCTQYLFIVRKHWFTVVYSLCYTKTEILFW